MPLTRYGSSSSSPSVYDPAADASCVLWLDANRGVTSSGNAVSQWVNQKNGAQSAAQATALYKPTLTTNYVGALSSIRFNASYMDFNFTLLSAAASCCIHFVCTASATQALLGNGNSTNYWAVIPSQNNLEAVISGVTTSTTLPVAVMSTLAVYTLEIGTENGRYRLSRNGRAYGQSTSAPAAGPSFTGIGRNIPTPECDGYYCEILALDNTSTPYKRMAALAYLLNRWQIS